MKKLILAAFAILQISQIAQANVYENCVQLSALDNSSRSARITGEEILHGAKAVLEGAGYRGVSWDPPAGQVEEILYCSSGRLSRSNAIVHRYLVRINLNGQKKESKYQAIFQDLGRGNHKLLSVRELMPQMPTYR